MGKPEWSNMHTVVKVGDVISVDAFLNGWVPGRVQGYTTDGQVRVKATADRPGYRRGEEFTARPNEVTPRPHIFTRNRQYRIRGSWEFDGLAAEHQPRWASPADGN